MSLLQRYTKAFISFLLSFHFITASFAQQEAAIFYHLTTENGLSTNRVNNVIQDREGFYWIATQDGLNRFDGSNCKIFRYDQNDSTSLSHNNCFFLLEDNAGDIWVATAMGVNRYKKSTGKFERFYFLSTRYNFEITNAITSMVMDNQGNLWVASYGLWQYNFKLQAWTRWIHDPQNESSVPDGFIETLSYDPQNHLLWMRHQNGFAYLDTRKNKFYHAGNNPMNNVLLTKNVPYPYALYNDGDIWYYNEDAGRIYRYDSETNAIKQLPEKIKQSISHLWVDKAGRVWFTYNWGIDYMIYDPRDNSFDSVFLNYYHPQSALSMNVVNGVYEDRAGNYWIPSPKGVSIYNPNAQFIKYFFLPKRPGAVANQELKISCFAEGSDEIIWVGTNDGLYQLNYKTRQFRFIKKLYVADDYIRSLYYTMDSLLWIGRHHELVVFDPRKEKIIKRIRISLSPQVITAGQNNTVLVGSWTKGIFLYSSTGELLTHLLKKGSISKSPAHDYIFSISALQPSYYRWIGYNSGNGFSKFNEKDSSFIHFKIPVSDNYSRISNSIGAITVDEKNQVWMGTYGGGLVNFDQEKNRFKNYTQNDGLKGNFINCILTDDSSQLWITTSNGLSIFDTRDNSIINPKIDLETGTTDIFTNGLTRRNKKLLFFAENKIIEIDPTLYHRSTYPSKILVSEFKVFDKAVPFHAHASGKLNIDLSFRQNFFSIEYSLLKPDPSRTTYYAYMLEGFDNDWNYVRERRNAFYTNVPDGQYRFLVKATNETGKWTHFLEPAIINIKPPFWKTWWFYTSTAILITGLLYGLYRYRVNHLKKVLLLRSKISQDLHDDIGATLSGIKVFSELAKDRPEGSKIYLDKINKYSDEMLDKMSDIVWNINPQNDNFDRTISKLHSYASSLASAKNIQLSFSMDEAFQKQNIKMIVRKNIYLIAKEAINNAVKYSMCKKITVSLTIHQKTGLLRINDDGAGFDPQLITGGNGLKNIRDRAEEIRGKVKIESKPGEGTRLELQYKFT
jgi:ligand-binding sensor domain-containing protein